jgi:RNA polymerase sigma-70 factor (ECF subfamily)
MALGELFESMRHYLLLVANAEVDDELRQKIAPSDLVQETFVRAQQGFAEFAGASEAELRMWLRQILLNHWRNLRRAYCETAKRQVGREIALNTTSSIVGPGIKLVAGDPTPSGQAIASEEAVLMAQAVSELPDDYQRIVRMRNWDDMSFEEISRRMGRTADSVRKIWYRAILLLGNLWDKSNDTAQRPRNE